MKSISKDEDIVVRLRKRAEIRRSIPRGEPDRISDLLEEAAEKIDRLRDAVEHYRYRPEYDK